MKPVAIDSVRKLVLTVNSDSSSVKFTAFAAGLDGVGWFYLVGDVIDPVPGLGARAAYVKQFIRDRLIDHKEYIHKHGEDMPEIRDWFGKTAPTRRKSRSAPFHNPPQPTHEPDPTA